MRYAKILIAIMQGKAVVLLKRGERRADVVVGKKVNKQFAINSMVGAVRALL